MNREGSLLRALVVEDEWPARNYLVELLEGSRLAEVVGAVATAEEARQALGPDGIAVDVAFVDVRIAGEGEGAGLALVRSLAKSPGAPLFVLATAFSEHAVEAFDLGVADYLLKPFTEDRVGECLRRLQTRRSHEPSSRPRRIVARRGKSLVFLLPEEVWAFEAADRTTRVHTPDGTFDLDLSLAAIETSLGRTLTRVHRNFLVNGAHVKELSRDGTETTLFVGTGIGPDRRGISVPVARERAQSVREALLENATGLRR
ncbi:MAG TPA: LytTR family DNA-binding domain-containing protein [Polyangiaceae bacterium]|nr:LytTR family DNA-binding domain-containing protein [Polyangiaceae bacterium]